MQLSILPKRSLEISHPSKVHKKNLRVPRVSGLHLSILGKKTKIAVENIYLLS